MSQAGSQAWAFYREVAQSRRVWTIRDKGGFPAPMSGSGRRAQPFWSSLSRTKKVIETVPAYSGFEPFEVSWEDFCTKWVPGLTKDGILVGVNWSGKRAVGFDIEPERLQQSVEALIENPTGESGTSKIYFPPPFSWLSKEFAKQGFTVFHYLSDGAMGFVLVVGKSRQDLLKFTWEDRKGLLTASRGQFPDKGSIPPMWQEIRKASAERSKVLEMIQKMCDSELS